MIPTRIRQLRHDERGSVSIWAVLIVAAFTLIVGISVDLTGQIAAKQRATDIAAQAGRVAGQQLEANTIMAGQTTARVNLERARTAALAYIASADMTGEVSVQAGGTELLVTTTASYQPVFLTSIGFGPLTVTGTATARLVRALEGRER
jgi:Flp pilus assembly protein TadG